MIQMWRLRTGPDSMTRLGQLLCRLIGWVRGTGAPDPELQLIRSYCMLRSTHLLFFFWLIGMEVRTVNT